MSLQWLRPVRAASDNPSARCAQMGSNARAAFAIAE
jgi:hypothetical protein